VLLLVLLALALQRTENRAGKYFVYYLAVAATWSFTSFMVHLNAPESQTLFWNKILIVVLIWTLVAYFQFAIGYTGKKFSIGLILLTYRLRY
jgi:hypothetical protein